MNKKLLTAAVATALAMPGLALAQSSVTLYGTIDTGLRSQSKVVESIDPVTGAIDSGNLTSMTEGLYRTNRWGMKGSEDLGDGLKANFTLEGQYASDCGGGPGSSCGGANQGLFQRKSIVGLQSGATTVDLGRDYTANFKAVGKYEQFSYNYTGLDPNVRFTAGVRSSNMVTAATNFAGFGIRLDYALGEQVGSTSNGTRWGIGADYAIAGFTIAGAYSNTKDPDGSGNRKDTNLGAKYGMGPWFVSVSWAQIDPDDNFGAPAFDKSRLWGVGAGFNFTPRLTGRIGYFDQKNTAGGSTTADGKAKTTLVDINYDLSKRTTLYAEFDHVTLDGPLDGNYAMDGNAVADGSNGFGVGIAHVF